MIQLFFSVPLFELMGKVCWRNYITIMNRIKKMKKDAKNRRMAEAKKRREEENQLKKEEDDVQKEGVDNQGETSGVNSCQTMAVQQPITVNANQALEMSEDVLQRFLVGLLSHVMREADRTTEDAVIHSEATEHARSEV